MCPETVKQRSLLSGQFAPEFSPSSYLNLLLFGRTYSRRRLQTLSAPLFPRMAYLFRHRSISNLQPAQGSPNCGYSFIFTHVFSANPAHPNDCFVRTKLRMLEKIAYYYFKLNYNNIESGRLRTIAYTRVLQHY